MYLFSIWQSCNHKLDWLGGQIVLELPALGSLYPGPWFVISTRLGQKPRQTLDKTEIRQGTMNDKVASEQKKFELNIEKQIQSSAKEISSTKLLKFIFYFNKRDEQTKSLKKNVQDETYIN